MVLLAQLPFKEKLILFLVKIFQSLENSGSISTLFYEVGINLTQKGKSQAHFTHTQIQITNYLLADRSQKIDRTVPVFLKLFFKANVVNH